MPKKEHKYVSLRVKTYSTKRSRPRMRIVKTPINKILPGNYANVLGSTERKQHTSTNNDCVEHEVFQSIVTNKRCYRDVKVAESAVWSGCREQILEGAVSVEEPFSYVCQLCHQTTEEPIRCSDCHPHFICCVACESQHHSISLHKPEIWLSKCVFVPYTAPAFKKFQRPDHECNSNKQFHTVELFDFKGRPHMAVIQFCSCEPLAVTLVRFGFWPSTPTRPKAAFSIELLSLMHTLTLECAVSVKGFVQALRWVNRMTTDSASRLYNFLIGECITEFRLFHRRKAEHFTSSKVGAVRCPACPLDNGTITVAMDGNFGLVRKLNSGRSYTTSCHSGVHFVDQDEIDSFVHSYMNDNVSDKECSQFLAGDAVRSKSRNMKLDIRGVFGSVCRHEYPLLFLDMKHGERLAYPVLLMKKLKNIIGGNMKMNVIYDIGCILHRHLVTHQPDLLRTVTLGVPVFHAYGHNASCQVQFSCRNLKGFALTDGEGTERLWSFLRPLASITKEMTPVHRRDLLSDALMHFTMRKNAHLAKWIDMRAVRANAVLQQSQESLDNFLKEMHVTMVQVKQWMMNLTREFASKVDTGKQNSTWETKYISNLMKYYEICKILKTSTELTASAHFMSELDMLHTSLQKIEKARKFERWLPTNAKFIRIAHECEVAEKEKILRQLHHDASERAFLVSLLSKYVDGQKIARRLSKQVQRATRSIRKGIELYNKLTVVYGSTSLPLAITFEQALNPSDSSYCQLMSMLQDDCSIPASEKLKAILLVQLCERSAEEKVQIQLDIKCCTELFTKEHTLLDSAIQSTTAVCSRAVLYRKLLELEELMSQLWAVSAKYVPDLPDLPHCDVTAAYKNCGTHFMFNSDSHDDLDSDKSESDSDGDSIYDENIDNISD